MSHAKIIGWNVDLCKLEAKVAGIQSATVLKPAKVFLQSLHDLDDLSMVPLLAAGEGLSLFYWAIGYMQKPIELATKTLRGEFPNRQELTSMESIEQRIEAADKWSHEYFSDPDKQIELARNIDRTLDKLCKKTSFHRALESMNYLAATGLWTALECLARDIWIESLNRSSVSTMHKAFSSLESDDATAKKISISDLARHGFDIRHHVGSLLASKYVFSDVSGIIKAFRVLDEKAFSIDGEVMQAVRKLEKTRHLLVHRGGFVDIKFKKETSCSEPEGARVQINADSMRLWFNSCISFGEELISIAERANE